MKRWPMTCSLWRCFNCDPLLYQYQCKANGSKQRNDHGTSAEYFYGFYIFEFGQIRFSQFVLTNIFCYFDNYALQFLDK